MTSLIEDIRNAFGPGTPLARPITVARFEECVKVDRLIGGKTWHEVADDFPEFCIEAYPLLTPEAKAYYLPAYMCFEVKNPNYVVGISLTMALELKELLPEQFTEPQQRVIARWIAHYYETDSDPMPDEVAARWRIDA